MQIWFQNRRMKAKRSKRVQDKDSRQDASEESDTNELGDDSNIDIKSPSLISEFQNQIQIKLEEPENKNS